MSSLDAVALGIFLVLLIVWGIALVTLLQVADRWVREDRQELLVVLTVLGWLAAGLSGALLADLVRGFVGGR